MSLRAFGLEIEAVVFDVDGVLLDTAAGWARTEEAFCAAYSVAYTPELAAGTHGTGLEDSVAVLTAGAPGRVEPRSAAALMRRLAEEHVPGTAEPMEGTLEAIEVIRRHVPVAIASNSERPLLELLLAASGHAALVDTVVSATDVAAPKPAPDVYLRATERLGVRPGAALVVEDSPTGAAAASAAGCSVVHFAPEPSSPPLPQAVATVRGHLDLLRRLGLDDPRHRPRTTPDGKGRP
ncbi:HAD family hydrolase [Geodermatophilus sp. SYSU D00815]